MYSSRFCRPMLLNRRICFIFPTTSNFSNYAIMLARKATAPVRDPRSKDRKVVKKTEKKPEKEEEKTDTTDYKVEEDQEFSFFGKKFRVKLIKTKQGYKQEISVDGMNFPNPPFIDKALKKLSEIEKFAEEQEKKAKEMSGENKKESEKIPNDDEIKTILQKIIGMSATMIAILILMRAFRKDNSDKYTFLSWTDFLNKILPSGMIEHITVVKDLSKAFVYMRPVGRDTPTIYEVDIPSVHSFEQEIRALETAHNIDPERWVAIQYKSMTDIGNFIILAILLGVVFLTIKFMRKSGSKSGSIFKMFDPSEMVHSAFGSKISILEPGHKKLALKFKDVAGLHEAKTEISEFVDYLKNPQKYTKLGAKLPKGALLTGPPGCGKTLLARALAAESTVPFLSINGTEFVEMIGGLGASRVRKMFETAKSKSPCIVYIDEIDAIGRKRSSKESMSGDGHSEFEQTLNQLLVEMDGVDSAKGIIMIASTNRPDVLDKALLRPGRFDRHITVDLPTILEREELFKMYLQKIKMNRPSDKAMDELAKRMAQLTPKMSGADIANVVNEGAMHAANLKRKFVYKDDLHAALEKVLAGPEKRSRILQDTERHIVAYHEAGHALVGWYLKYTDALLKVTIIPRTNAALGFAQYKPKDRKLYRREELFDRMCMMLGGRAAEDIKFNQVTTGAQNDLEKVTKLSYGMVKRYGMSDAIGPISFGYPGQEEREEAFLKKPYSKKLSAMLDEEARTIVARAYSSTVELLKSNMDKLDLLAKELLKREVLDYEQVKALIGPPKYGDKDVVEVPEQELPDLDSDDKSTSI